MPLASRRLLLAALPFACLGACAPPASYSAMVAGVPPGLGPTPVYRNAITVGSVTLGRDDGTPWTSAVGPDQVQQALGTATLDDAVDNNNRLRIADQRAIRANLQQLVQDLYALPPR